MKKLSLVNVAIVSSMTPEERENPDLLNPSRRRRIAAGSGNSFVEVNKFIKDFNQAKQMMQGVMSGDMEKAIELLREKGMAKAAKKADRVAAEGLTGLYVDGNVAAVVEVNAETDFVAQNAQFVELVKETAKAIAEQKPDNNEEALKVTLTSGETLEAAYVNATATIGEKISFRRFALIEKTDDQHFGAYQHNGGRIGVVSVIEGGDEAIDKTNLNAHRSDETNCSFIF